MRVAGRVVGTPGGERAAGSGETNGAGAGEAADSPCGRGAVWPARYGWHAVRPGWEAMAVRGCGGAGRLPSP